MPCKGCEPVSETLREICPDMLGLVSFNSLRWNRLDPHIESSIRRCLDAWRGTPYMPGQRARGLGADCVQLVAGVLDTLYRREKPSDVPRKPPSSGAHSPAIGADTIKALLEAFPCNETNGDIEPGDVVVVRASRDPMAPANPGHAMIVSPKIGYVMHADPVAGAVYASILDSKGIIRVYRPKEKWSWA